MDPPSGLTLALVYGGSGALSGGIIGWLLASVGCG